MKLIDHITKVGITYGQFAKMIAVKDARTVHRYVHGIRYPHPAIMRRIIIATGGEVQPADFFSVPITDASLAKTGGGLVVSDPAQPDVKP